MSDLYMIEIELDLVALHRFMQGLGLIGARVPADDGYALHAWLAGAFGQTAPKPWRVLMLRGKAPCLLAYSSLDAETLRGHMLDYANPQLCEVAIGISGKLMRVLSDGRRLGFDVLCCPVERQSRTGVEKDAFLGSVEKHGAGHTDRGTVYCALARRLIESHGGAEVRTIRLNGFSLVEQLRKGAASLRPRKKNRLIRPHALLSGELIVTDSTAFMSMLAAGIGRHKAFGYGMMLLRPPS